MIFQCIKLGIFSNSRKYLLADWSHNLNKISGDQFTKYFLNALILILAPP